MRDRDLVPAVLVAALACCGAMALIVGLIGGVALATIGRFTAASVAGLGLVVTLAWWLDRRRHRHDCGETNDRPAHAEQSPR